jgi:hypothetical protein
VELTRKAQRRLEEIVRVWRRAVTEGRFEQVTYHCSREVLPSVERAMSE